MKKRLFSIALCLTFILSATSVSAQDAAYREALSKMLEASGAMTTVKSMVPQMIGMMKHTYSNVPDEFWKNFEEQLSEKANTQFLDIYVSIYHRYLTISDLKKITAFLGIAGRQEAGRVHSCDDCGSHGSGPTDRYGNCQGDNGKPQRKRICSVSSYDSVTYNL